jgi:hypothetical protein
MSIAKMTSEMGHERSDPSSVAMAASPQLPDLAGKSRSGRLGPGADLEFRDPYRRLPVRDISQMEVEPNSQSTLAQSYQRLHHRWMEIRAANEDDAVEACRILRRSITELCQVDHGDDPAVVANWLQNKTPDNVRSWISHPASYVIVATDTTRIVGVGAITSSSEITLNYVSPDARFQGISKAILQRLEARSRVLGNTTCTLSVRPETS